MISIFSVIPSAKHTHAHGHVRERAWLSRLWKAREMSGLVRRQATDGGRHCHPGALFTHIPSGQQ